MSGTQAVGVADDFRWHDTHCTVSVMRILRGVEEMTMTATRLRDVLGERIDAAHYRGDVTLVTKNGQVRAALVPVDLYRQPERATTDTPEETT